MVRAVSEGDREAKIAVKHRQKLGGWGEQQAAAYLADRGYKLLDRNVHTPYGEIDLIFKKDDRIVFVEVKTRTSTQYGYPEQSVTLHKRRHLIASAQFYLQNQPEMIDDWQIDVLAVEKKSNQETPAITHFENVFSDLP